MINLNNSAKSLVIFLIIYSVFIQYFLNNIVVYNALKILFYLIFFFLFLFIIRENKIKTNLTLNIYVICVFFYAINLLVLSLFSSEILFQPIIVYILLGIIGLISLNIKLEENEIYFLLKWFLIVSALVSNLIIISYGTGYEISEQYLFKSKNQIGQFLSLSIVIITHSFLNKYTLFSQKKYLEIVFKSILLISYLLPVIIIRSRSALIGALIIVLIMFLLNLNFKKISITKILSSLLVFLIFYFSFGKKLFNLIYESITLNQNVSNLDSFSSNRTEVYYQAINFIKENLFFGNYLDESNIFDPHNFLIYQIFNYGIIGSFPIVCFYFLCLLFCVVKIFRKNTDDIDNLSVYCLLTIIFASLTEYSPPFGPITTTIIVWYLFFRKDSFTLFLGGKSNESIKRYNSSSRI